MSTVSFLPLLITAAGVYFLFKLKFFFILHPKRVLSKFREVIREPSSFSALSLALAGTLGVGNIIGVAVGISVGGAGSLFWIFVSALFSSVIKYAESTLSADMKSDTGGGMMFVIRKSFKGLGKPMSCLYALLCLLLSFTMGSALQTNSASASFESKEGSVIYVFAIFFCVLLSVFILLGTEKIKKLTSILIPCATVLYVLLCLILIAVNIRRMPGVILKALREAFNFKSSVGGIFGFLFSLNIKEGFARGLLSNEAGAGTSAMAQSESRQNEPSAAGLLGMSEVFFDTTLLCTLTGLALLMSVPDISELSGISLILSAVRSVFSGFGGFFIGALISVFAFSTVVCWYFYGKTASEYIFGKSSGLPFAVLFLISAFTGFFISSKMLIEISDYILFFMTVLTLLTLIKNSERLVALSEKYGLLKKSDMGKGSKSE